MSTRTAQPVAICAPSPYAAAASPRFDAWLTTELGSLAVDVARTVGDTFDALVLGGGYGRGEGGTVRRAGLERPYNDLDLFLFARQPGRVPRERLAQVAEHYRRRLGVEVDISRAYRAADVARWQPTLMWHDLMHGHRVLVGPDDLLTARCPASVLQPPPASEGLRLLLNRGAGLLWALRVRRGAESAPDADFVRRNYYKCALALGDALLIAHRAYGTRLAGRTERLAALFADKGRGAPSRDVLPLYRRAVQFKVSPDSLPGSPPAPAEMASLAGTWTRTLLRVESLRTGRDWSRVDEYVAWNGLREPAASSALRMAGHLVRQLRSGVVGWRHPREALYRQLPGLLTVARTDAHWQQASAAFLARWRAVS